MCKKYTFNTKNTADLIKVLKI